MRRNNTPLTNHCDLDHLRDGTLAKFFLDVRKMDFNSFDTDDEFIDDFPIKSACHDVLKRFLLAMQQQCESFTLGTSAGAQYRCWRLTPLAAPSGITSIVSTDPKSPDSQAWKYPA